MITSEDIPEPKPEPNHRPLPAFSSQAGLASFTTDREIRSGDPLDCPGCGYDPMAPHNGKGDCAPSRGNGSES